MSSVCQGISRKKAKLDGDVNHDIYLGNTATSKIIHYRDHKSGTCKTGMHVAFDEAHITLARELVPPAAIALQNLGYNNEPSRGNRRGDSFLHVQLLSESAKLPTRGTQDSAGLDLFSAVDTVLPPKSITVIPTDIAIQCPKGTYMRIATRSSLALKGLDCRAGVIDPDYRGNINIIMRNDTETSVQINQGSKIAQGIIENYTPTIPVENTSLNSTERQDAGFGSTNEPQEVVAPVVRSMKVQPNKTSNEPVISDIPIELPYNIFFSTDPYNNHLKHTVNITGIHKTLGMELKKDVYTGRLQLQACTPGTPVARIPKWRSQLVNSTVLKVNDVPVTTIPEVEQIIKNMRINKESKVTIIFGTVDKVPIHPSYGVPQIHFDQLNVIANHLHELKGNQLPDCNNGHTSTSIPTISKAQSTPRFTRRFLKQQKDWDEWLNAEFKQHDDYEQQNMFGSPCWLPKGANVLPFYWDYKRKAISGQYKARCVVNGAPTQKGSVTLAQTYAAALEQPGARIFWATAANESMYVIGSDATNAFAEAPPPVASLYVLIDEPYRQWWTQYIG